MSGVNEVLDKLFAKGVIDLESGREVAIKKVTLRTMKPVTVLLTKIMEDLKLDQDNLPSVDLADSTVILKLISKYYDDIVEVVVSLTDVSKDDLLDMTPDQSVPVIQAVLLLNKNFFTTKVLPSLRLMGDALGSATA